MSGVELHPNDWFTIRGRGDIAVVDTRKPPFSNGHVVHVGDTVSFDDRDGEYQVVGIEQSRQLTDPPKLSPTVGLQVRKVQQSAYGVHRLGVKPSERFPTVVSQAADPRPDAEPGVGDAAAAHGGEPGDQ